MSKYLTKSIETLVQYKQQESITQEEFDLLVGFIMDVFEIYRKDELVEKYNKYVFKNNLQAEGTFC